MYGTSVREPEFKRVVATDFKLRPKRMVISGASAAGPETRRVRDVYFDTEDLRLVRWGVTLRWRVDEGWMVKIPRPSSTAAMLDREEVHIDGDPTALPAEAVALVAPFARKLELVPVAHFDTDRTVRAWRRPDGTVIGELVDDRVVAMTKDGPVCFREIEFELAVDADPAALKAAAEFLSAGDMAAVPTRLVRALGDAAAGPADVVGPTLPKRPTAAEVIHAAIASSVHQVLTNIPAARLGTYPEGVHQARVATRRLRSDLRTFAPLLDKQWAKQLRRELKWLAGELGAVRDADVLDARIATALDANPGIAPDSGKEIGVHLARQREQERLILLEHLAESRAIELFDHLVVAAASPRVRRRAQRPRGVATLRPLVQATWDDLRTRVGELGLSPADADLHEIRILAKRARYAAEAVAPAVGTEAAKFAKAAASVQGSLGDFHDSSMAAAWLEHAAIDGLSARAAFAAGRLVQQLRTEAAADRTSWQLSYDKMRRRSRWLADDT